MQGFYDDNGFHIKSFRGNEVSLPRDEDVVEAVRYLESGIVGIYRKSEFKKSLQRGSADVSPSAKSSEPTYHFAAETPATSAASVDIANDDIIAVEGKLTDMRTGEIVGICKHEDNLRRAFNTQYDKVLSSLSSHNTLFVTATLDSIVTYKTMQHAVSGFERWVKGLCNFRFGAHFLEPHADGNWHVHLLLYFRDCIPESTEDAIVRWWNARNGKPCDEQVDVVEVVDDEHLLNILEYLKPTRGEKRERIKYYPVGKQPMGCFGDVQKPERKLEVFEDVKSELGKEFDEYRRRLEKYHPNTNELISFVARYLFKAKPAKDNTVSPLTYNNIISEPPDKQGTVTFSVEWCGSRRCLECLKKDRCDDFLVMSAF